jgi:hypothetical protein
MVTTAGTPSGAKPGYGENAVAALGMTTFGGVAVDSLDLLIKFTYGGDADLRGQVDITDYGLLATSWQTSAPWTGGDFDYSGFVDITDLGILSTNWQQGVNNPLRLMPGGFDPTNLYQALQLYPVVFEAALNDVYMRHILETMGNMLPPGSLGVVPEPITLLGPLTVLLIRRRRISHCRRHDRPRLGIPRFASSTS